VSSVSDVSLADAAQQVTLDRGNEVEEMKALLDSFFASFVSLGAAGMQRPDPQVPICAYMCLYVSICAYLCLHVPVSRVPLPLTPAHRLSRTQARSTEAQ